MGHHRKQFDLFQTNHSPKITPAAQQSQFATELMLEHALKPTTSSSITIEEMVREPLRVIQIGKNNKSLIKLCHHMTFTLRSQIQRFKKLRLKKKKKLVMPRRVKNLSKRQVKLQQKKEREKPRRTQQLRPMLKSRKLRKHQRNEVNPRLKHPNLMLRKKKRNQLY